MSETVNTQQRVTAAELARIAGFSRAHICGLKKKGKLLFDKDPDGHDRIILTEALTQLEGSKDFNRDPQRAWAETQRKGRNKKPGHAAVLPQPGTIDPANPHNLPQGNTPALLLQPGDIRCQDSRIGVETQRSKLMRETYDARLSEMEFREKSGELVTVQGVIEANRRIAGSIRSKLIALGTKLAPRLEGKTAAEIQFTIEDEVNAIFTDLYSQGGGKEEE